jgi:uncharacterized protein (TIGR02145 family)
MKQKNKIQLLLVAAFAGLSVMCYAQGKLCKDADDGYKIVSLQDPSDHSEYKWTEDGKDIDVSTAEHTVLSSKALGKYTYVRRSKKDGCDWASSNAYTVEVLTCGTITPDAIIGTKGTFKDDRDGKIYKIVKMPDEKVWMAENLNYQVDLAFIQEAKHPNDGGHIVGSFWCPAVSGATLSSNKNTCNTYGALYTWETAMSPNGLGTWEETDALKAKYHDSNTTPQDAENDPQVQGICPKDWHLPTDYEWAVLLDAVDPHCGSYTSQVGCGWYGSDGVAGLAEGVGAGVQMKSALTYFGADPGNGAWADDDKRGNDATGFGAVPAGDRDITIMQLVARSTYVAYWSSSVGSPSNAWYRGFASIKAQVDRFLNSRSYGFSVRCVRD